MTIKILYKIFHLFFDDDNAFRSDVFTLANNYKLRQSFYTDDFIKHVGTLEMDEPENSVFAFCHLEAPKEYDSQSKDFIIEQMSKQAYARLQYINAFLSFLWLVKDNSISTGMVTGQVIDRQDYLIKMTETSIISNCIGEYKDVHYSKIELEKAHDLWMRYSLLCPRPHREVERAELQPENQETKTIMINPLASDFNYNDNNCLQRAMVFLATARKTPYLVYKISFYVPIFECLFTTDASEITTKVSERIAFYLGNTKDERKEIAKTIRLAYNVRSRFLHGQNFKTDKEISYDKLKSLSIRIDEITRAILTRVIMTDSGDFLQKNENAKNDFLSNLIFQ